MKKIVICILMITAIVLLAGCGKDDKPKADNDIVVSDKNSNKTDSDNNVNTVNNGKDKDNGTNVKDEDNNNNTKDENNNNNAIEEDNNNVKDEDNDNKDNDNNGDDGEPVDGGDWRTYRSYTSDFQIKSDLTVCLSPFDDGSGYGVYDSRDGSRIGSLVAELDGNELIVCADYDEDGIFELCFGGTPSGDIWFRYVDRSWDEGGCFEEYDFSQMEPQEVDYIGDSDSDYSYDGGDYSNETEFMNNLVELENLNYVDVVNTTALGIYMEDVEDFGNSRYFYYADGEVSFETMDESDCAYLTLYADPYGESELCFLREGINNDISWNLEDSVLVLNVDGTEYTGRFYYDSEATTGNGMYICLFIGDYNLWLRCYNF